MDYVDFDSLAQKLAPTLQVLENKRKELLRKGRSEGLIYAQKSDYKFFSWILHFFVSSDAPVSHIFMYIL